MASPQPILLELFSGTGVMSAMFRRAGWRTFTVDWSLPADLNTDIGRLTVDDVTALCGRRPDVIWASPDCTTFSVAAIGHHRRRDPDTGLLLPRTAYARECDRTDTHMMRLITMLHPCYWFVENPRGGMRRAPFMQNMGRRHTITFCQYGESRMKPTDIWTNHPHPGFHPPCRNGDSCHQAAPRGSRTGTQGMSGRVERARLPEAFCRAVAAACTPLPDVKPPLMMDGGWVGVPLVEAGWDA